MPDLDNDNPTPDFDDLIEQAQRLREWAQEDPAAWFYVGILEHENGRVEEAREAYGQVPENDPNYVQAMLLAGEFWECDGVFYEAEEYYQKALDAAPRSREARLAYLYNHIKILLEEAAENGFDRDRVDRASEFIGKIYRVLSGSDNEPEQDVVVGGAEARSLPPPHPELYERYMAELSQRQNQLAEELSQRQNQLAEERHQEIREWMERSQGELKILREQLDQALFKQEEITIAALETISRHVADRLGLPDVELGRCEERLRGECEVWEKLESDSRRCLATGDYILEKGAIGMEYSGVAIQYTKPVEIELKQTLIDPFISFAEQRGLGSDTVRRVFREERERITLGNIHYAFTQTLRWNSGESRLLNQFMRSFEDRGRYLLREFPNDLEKIKSIRDEAAHRGEIARGQAQSLRKQVLKMLPKIVALRSC